MEFKINLNEAALEKAANHVIETCFKPSEPGYNIIVSEIRKQFSVLMEDYMDKMFLYKFEELATQIMEVEIKRLIIKEIKPLVTKKYKKEIQDLTEKTFSSLSNVNWKDVMGFGNGGMS
jgi:hypothetical protein